MSKKSKGMKKAIKNSALLNSLAELTRGVEESQTFSSSFGNYGMLSGNQFPPSNSRIDTVFFNTRNVLISNFRNVLNNAYAEYGIVQTLCRQPVQDALRTGYTIKGRKLSTTQIQELEYTIEKEQVNKTIEMAFSWARLFGGAGIVINTDQNPSTPLKLEKLKKDSTLEIWDADMWELYPNYAETLWNPFENVIENNMYNYYGKDLHPSRVIPIIGSKAPSMLRPRLKGWGMSELEKVVRSINSYLKNQNLIFELLDEAKIDVYQMQGFNSAMLTSGGTSRVQSRIQTANLLKNYLNALILDANDKYDQKQLSFNGLSEILTQIRQGVASDLKMPMTKLFGVSAAGFNSGEDDIENYNSMIESEIRSQMKFVIIRVLEIYCQKLFGHVPENLNIDFKPLRTLSAEQEENKKNNLFNRLIEARANGLCSDYEWMLGCNNENLLPFVYPEAEIESAQNMNRTTVDLVDGNVTEDEKSRIFGKKEETDGQVEMAENLELQKELGGEKGAEVSGISEQHKKAIPDKGTLTPNDDSYNDHEIVKKTDERAIDSQRKKFSAQETSGRKLKPIEPNKPIPVDKTGTVDEGLPIQSKFDKSNRENVPAKTETYPYKRLGAISKFIKKTIGIK